MLVKSKETDVSVWSSYSVKSVCVSVFAKNSFFPSGKQAKL